MPQQSHEADVHLHPCSPIEKFGTGPKKLYSTDRHEDPKNIKDHEVFIHLYLNYETDAYVWVKMIHVGGENKHLEERTRS